MSVQSLIALLTATLTLASWVYRFVDEYSPYQEIWFYILVPLIVWLLFAGALFLTRNVRRWSRILGWVLLVPATLLWIIAILVGMFGLKIH